MRVIYYGNQGNFGFRYCTWLRKKGIEADLYFDFRKKDGRNFPEWEHKAIGSDYPEWIYNIKSSQLDYIVKNKVLRNAPKSYSLLITSGESILKTLTVNLPIVFKPVGSDITRLPFSSGNLTDELKSYLFRKRAHRICAVLSAQEDCYWASQLLGIKRYYFNPLPIDMDSMNSNIDEDYLSHLKEKYQNYKLVIFHPTRKNIAPFRRDYKGNEKFLFALKDLCNEEKDSMRNVKVVMGMHGNDVAEFRQMIDQLNFPDNLIDYVDHLSLPKLHSFMKMDNIVVVDQFGELEMLNLAGITRESLGMGAPLICSINTSSQRFVQSYAESCPVLPASNQAEIFKKLKEVLLLSADDYLMQRDYSINWARKNLHWENRIDEFIEILNEVANDYYHHQ